MRLLLGAALVVAGLSAPSHSAARPVTLYPLGDSITFGSSGAVVVAGRRTDTTTAGGYRGTLDLLLTADGLPHSFVGSRHDNATVSQRALGEDRHDGWPGFRVDQAAQVASGLGTDPDVVLLMVGTNDVLQRYDPGARYPGGRVAFGDAHQRALFVAHLTARLHDLVDSTQALHPGVRVVVATIPPLTAAGGFGPPDAVTPSYAAAVRRLVAGERRRGERVELADVWSALVEGTAVRPGDLAHDGVHPSATGYRRMATEFAGAVERVLAD